MFKVMVQGKTREELIAQMLEFVSMIGIQSESPEGPHTEAPTGPPPAEAKRGRGRPKKTEEMAPEKEPVPSEPPPTVSAKSSFDDPFDVTGGASSSESKSYSPEQVRSALMEYAKARTGDAPDAGAKRVYTLIQQFGYKNVKEIKPEHYAQIMAGTGLA